MHIGDDPGEIVAKARLRRADKLGERGVTQITVDGQNTLTLDGKADGQVGDTKDLPAPGLNDVTAMTLLPGSRIMNSKLVRSTLNASLTTLRLP